MPENRRVNEAGIPRELLDDYDTELDAKIKSTRGSEIYIGFEWGIRRILCPENPSILSDETVRYIMHDWIVAARKESE